MCRRFLSKDLGTSWNYILQQIPISSLLKRKPGFSLLNVSMKALSLRPPMFHISLRNALGTISLSLNSWGAAGETASIGTSSVGSTGRASGDVLTFLAPFCSGSFSGKTMNCSRWSLGPRGEPVRVRSFPRILGRCRRRRPRARRMPP